MTVKELILDSLESFEDFKVQYSYYKGEVKELTVTQNIYLQIADQEIDYYYLDTDNNGKPYISIKLKVR